jgi:hypothetical protein
MPSKRRADAQPRKASPAKLAPEIARGLERRVKRLERELAEARATHERRVELVRRAANRRLAAMMKELATLRHHEARAEALERLLASRAASAATEGKADGKDPRLPG